MTIDQALEELDVAGFWERGYAILHDVYTPEEIAAIREAAYATHRDGGDLLANPRLQHVLTDGRMVAVARRLLDTDDIYYAGDSSFTINGTQRGWHKDNTDRRDADAPDWDDRYTQLRFGIYCQDHTEHTGGLNLRVGSHDIANLTDGETLYVKTRPGDLAVWSMRITHSGNGMLLKDPDAPYPDPSEQPGIDPADVAPADGDRIAVFAHLGANDKHGRRYSDYLKTRTYMVQRWRQRPYTDDDRRAAAAAGLTLRDMPEEVRDDKRAGLDAEWRPFPYPGWTPPQPPRPAARKAAAEKAGARSVTKAAPPPPPPATGGARALARRGRAALRGARAGWRAGR